MNLTAQLDPRLHAYRPDLADISLRHTVTAARFVEPVLRQCIRGVAPLLAAPDHDAKLVSEVRYGEFLDVFELPAAKSDGFAWVQNRSDRYVGYMPFVEALSEQIADLSSRINVLRTYIYPEPDVKSPPIDELTLGSYVRLGASEGKFRKLATGGYVFAKHAAPATDTTTTDYVFTAGRLLNVPYLWGGRTPRGIDCSGLIQLSLEMAGVDCPRDSDQQREAFGKSLPCHWRDVPWRRGDIVFMKGHVGIMTGPDHMIHASGYHMLVTVEPLIDAVFATKAEIIGMGRPEGF